MRKNDLWINSTGGPLLLVADDLQECWLGVSPKAGISDYERACLCENDICLIGVGHGAGLVLGDEPSATTWMPLTTTGHPMLVRWICANDEHQLLAYAHDAPEDAFQSQTITYTANVSRHVLFDSSLGGNLLKPDEFLEVSLPPGRYHIDAGIWSPDASTAMVLHRFKRSAVPKW